MHRIHDHFSYLDSGNQGYLSVALSETYMAVSFSGFEQKLITVSSDDGPIDIACHVGGSGPALLLLHGFPQTKAIWHQVAPALVKHYTVVAADLRGYGASSKPHGKSDHSTYSKRSMAADQVALMKSLGHLQFFLLGFTSHGDGLPS